MDSRTNSAEEDFRKAEALLSQIDNQIHQTDFDINSEMERRERSYEAALQQSAEEQEQIRKLLQEDETFHLYYLEDDLDPGLQASKLMKKLKNTSSSSSKGKKPNVGANAISSGNKHLVGDEDDFDDGGFDDDDESEDDDREPTQKKNANDDDDEDEQQHRAERHVKDPFNSDYADGKIPDAPLDNFWRVEGVLARKTVKGRLFYRVKWKNANLVTWELNSKIENRVAVDQFEAQRYAAAHFECVNKKKLRPAVYVSQKRLERIAKKDAEAAKRIREEMKVQKEMENLEDVAVGADVIWSCEVEPHIWIPYDVDSQKSMEAAFRLRQRSCQINVSGMVFDINIAAMHQSRNGGGTRRIQRVVVQPTNANNASSSSSSSNNRNNSSSGRPNFDEMTLGQLRDFVARAQSLQDPLAFEALNRLEEMDQKAVPSGVGKSVVEKFPKYTFEEIMGQICNGVEFPSFSTECHICLEDYVGDSSLTCLPQCQHLFHTKCIEDFLGKYSKVCPICRERVV